MVYLDAHAVITPTSLYTTQNYTTQPSQHNTIQYNTIQYSYTFLNNFINLINSTQRSFQKLLYVKSKNYYKRHVCWWGYIKFQTENWSLWLLKYKYQNVFLINISNKYLFDFYLKTNLIYLTLEVCSIKWWRSNKLFGGQFLSSKEGCGRMLSWTSATSTLRVGSPHERLWVRIGNPQFVSLLERNILKRIFP